MRHLLKPHPAAPCATVQTISVEAERRKPGELWLHFVLQGNMAQLRVPAPDASLRTDNLWHHTCFEAFIAPGTSPTYREYNLSPSTRWAAYSFTGFRQGMADLPQPVPPVIALGATPHAMELTARVVPDLPPDMPWRLALTTVVESTNGDKSFWSLAHPAEKPEFHHPDGFVLQLPAP